MRSTTPRPKTETRPALIRFAALRRLAPAILLSLALHAIIGVWLVRVVFSVDVESAPEDPVVSFSLRIRPTEPPQQPQRTTPAVEEPMEPAPDPPAESAPAATLSAATATPPESSQPSEHDRSPGTGGRISARILEQVGALHAPDLGAGEREAGWTRSGAPVAGLPGHRGWLAGYVGRVTPSTDQWQAPDGSREARHVLPDGTVICSRRRAPTAEEMIHPMRAMIVTMARICGRQRPQAPDYADLKVRPPPGGTNLPEGPAPRD